MATFRKESGEPVAENHPMICDQCGGTHSWKDGTYAVINWVWLLTVGWLVGCITSSFNAGAVPNAATNWFQMHRSGRHKPGESGGNRCVA